MADTVGFIRKLPHQLVEAFKATLEEVVLADFIVEVVDINSPQVEEHHATTREVLAELGVTDTPVILVFNKVDLLDNTYLRPRLRRRHPDALFVSARTGEGMEPLMQRLAEHLAEQLEPVDVLIPHDRYDLAALLHRTSHVLSEKHTDAGTRIRAAVPGNVLPAVENFLEVAAEES